MHFIVINIIMNLNQDAIRETDQNEVCVTILDLVVRPGILE